MGVFLVVVLVVLVVGGFAVALAVSGRRKAAAQAGLPGGVAVPASWAGAHSAEARLHRRLAAAARALEALPLGDAASIERRVAVEQRVRALDARLVAAAAIPGEVGVAALAEVETMVSAVEAEVARAAAEQLELGD